MIFVFGVRVVLNVVVMVVVVVEFEDDGDDNWEDDDDVLDFSFGFIKVDFMFFMEGGQWQCDDEMQVYLIEFFMWVVCENIGNFQEVYNNFIEEEKIKFNDLVNVVGVSQQSGE